GGDREPDDVAVKNIRDEPEPDAELTEADGNRRGNARRGDLGDGHRELAAGQEAGELAVQGYQVGLGEDLEDAVAPQGLEHELKIGALEDAEHRGRCAIGGQVR